MSISVWYAQGLRVIKFHYFTTGVKDNDACTIPLHYCFIGFKATMTNQANFVTSRVSRNPSVFSGMKNTPDASYKDSEALA